MKEQKELKKLNLEKEEIINLNEYEMDAVKGGSTWACSIASVALTYEIGKDSSWWNCQTPAPAQTPTSASTPTPTPTSTGSDCTCGCTLAPKNWTI